jgi:hypothetical protein
MSLLARIRKLEQTIKPNEVILPLLCVFEQRDGTYIDRHSGKIYSEEEVEAYGNDALKDYVGSEPRVFKMIYKYPREGFDESF